MIRCMKEREGLQWNNGEEIMSVHSTKRENIGGLIGSRQKEGKNAGETRGLKERR